MAASPTIEEQGRNLNCPFSWDLSDRIRCTSVDVLEADQLDEIEGNPDVKIKAELILAFAFTVNDKNDKYDYAKALSYADGAVTDADDDGYRFVAKATRFNILRMWRKPEANRKALLELQDEEHNLSSSSLARVLITQAYALSLFLSTRFEQAQELCAQAFTLDPSFGEAYYLHGLITGRLRRQQYGNWSDPWEIELSSLKRAIQLWPSSPLPHVFYAETMRSELYARGTQQIVAIRKMNYHLSKALDIALQKLQGRALKRISKVYKYIAKLDGKCRGFNFEEVIWKEEVSINLALELLPNNASVLHEAALCHWTSSPKLKNMVKAKEYLQRASERSTTSNYRTNVWADIDYVKIRKEMDNQFDDVDGYACLLPRYDNDAMSKHHVHVAIGKAYIEQKLHDEAYDELKAALRLNPELEECKKLLNTTIEKLVDINRWKVLCSRMSVDDCVSQLFDFAHTLETFQLVDRAQAGVMYGRVLEIQPENVQARDSLQTLINKLPNGEDTSGLDVVTNQLQNLTVSGDALVEPSTNEFYNAHCNEKVSYHALFH